MDMAMVQAFNIVRGTQNGDEFIWDHEWTDEKGKRLKGRWKSAIDAVNKNNAGRIILP